MIKDKCGQEIVAGSYILYTVRKGDTAELQFGKVVRTTEEPNRWNKNDIDYQITVQGVENRWNGLRPFNRKSTLQFPEHIIVLSDRQVPDEVLRLLK